MQGRFGRVSNLLHTVVMKLVIDLARTQRLEQFGCNRFGKLGWMNHHPGQRRRRPHEEGRNVAMRLGLSCADFGGGRSWGHSMMGNRAGLAFAFWHRLRAYTHRVKRGNSRKYPDRLRSAQMHLPELRPGGVGR
jgi:hypothetical protein